MKPEYKQILSLISKYASQFTPANSDFGFEIGTPFTTNGEERLLAYITQSGKKTTLALGFGVDPTKKGHDALIFTWRRLSKIPSRHSRDLGERITEDQAREDFLKIHQAEVNQLAYSEYDLVETMVEEFHAAIKSQKEAIAENMEEEGLAEVDDYNKGWLHSFEEAYAKALERKKKLKKASKEKTYTLPAFKKAKEEWIDSLLEPEIELATIHPVAYSEGRKDAWANWWVYN